MENLLQNKKPFLIREKLTFHPQWHLWSNAVKAITQMAADGMSIEDIKAWLHQPAAKGERYDILCTAAEAKSEIAEWLGWKEPRFD